MHHKNQSSLRNGIWPAWRVFNLNSRFGNCRHASRGPAPQRRSQPRKVAFNDPKNGPCICGNMPGRRRRGFTIV